MIEFTKLHVKQALEAAAENAEIRDVPYTDDSYISEESILNSYNYDNIK